MEARKVNHEDIWGKLALPSVRQREELVQRPYSGNSVGNQGRKRFSWAGVDMRSENFMLSEKV